MVNGTAAPIILMDTVETLVEPTVTVLCIVAAGCVSSTVTVESSTSVAGVTVVPGVVTVFVTSTVCMTVVSAACCSSEEVGAELELPSTATTEYRLSGKASLG